MTQSSQNYKVSIVQKKANKTETKVIMVYGKAGLSRLLLTYKPKVQGWEVSEFHIDVNPVDWGEVDGVAVGQMVIDELLEVKE